MCGHSLVVSVLNLLHALLMTQILCFDSLLVEALLCRDRIGVRLVFSSKVKLALVRRCRLYQPKTRASERISELSESEESASKSAIELSEV